MVTLYSDSSTSYISLFQKVSHFLVINSSMRWRWQRSCKDSSRCATGMWGASRQKLGKGTRPDRKLSLSIWLRHLELWNQVTRFLLTIDNMQREETRYHLTQLVILTTIFLYQGTTCFLSFQRNWWFRDFGKFRACSLCSIHVSTLGLQPFFHPSARPVMKLRFVNMLDVWNLTNINSSTRVFTNPRYGGFNNEVRQKGTHTTRYKKWDSDVNPMGIPYDLTISIVESALRYRIGSYQTCVKKSFAKWRCIMKSECLLGRPMFRVCLVWNVSFLPGVASFRLQEIFFVDITHDVCCKVLPYEQRLHRHRNSSRIWADERHSEQQSWVVRHILSCWIPAHSNLLVFRQGQTFWLCNWTIWSPNQGSNSFAFKGRLDSVHGVATFKLQSKRLEEMSIWRKNGGESGFVVHYTYHAIQARIMMFEFYS